MSGYRPTRILVTGGAGFIGANFVRHLLAEHADARVVNLDLLTYAGSLASLECLASDGRYTFVKGDVCDQPLVESLLRAHGLTTIVHFAAESHVDRSIEGPAAFVRTNISGTFSLLEAARRVWLEEGKRGPADCRFHHISTDEVYGTLSREDPAFTEQTAYAPNSPYSASKAAADHLVRAYQHTYGLPTIKTNCSNNYGPYQHDEKFIPTVIRSCRAGRRIPVYGDGSNVRDWLYVADHCAGVDAALCRGRVGETYNIGGGNEWANIDLARLICRTFDELRPGRAPHEELITFVRDRPGHDWRYAVDARKIEKELDWRPRETLHTGMRKTIEWYLRERPEPLAEVVA
jgi:dTDP-glucose 4,6-dehydratase